MRETRKQKLIVIFGLNSSLFWYLTNDWFMGLTTFVTQYALGKLMELYDDENMDM